MAKKIVDEKISITERMELEDKLIELVYEIAKSLETSPEDFDILMSKKIAKSGILKPIGDIKIWFRNKLEEESK